MKKKLFVLMIIVATLLMTGCSVGVPTYYSGDQVEDYITHAHPGTVMVEEDAANKTGDDKIYYFEDRLGRRFSAVSCKNHMYGFDNGEISFLYSKALADYYQTDIFSLCREDIENYLNERDIDFDIEESKGAIYLNLNIESENDYEISKAAASCKYIDDELLCFEDGDQSYGNYFVEMRSVFKIYVHPKDNPGYVFSEQDLFEKANNISGLVSLNSSTTGENEDNVPVAGTEEESAAEQPTGEYDFTICFAGDMNLSEDYGTTRRIDSSENGVFDYIDGELVDIMQNSDMCIVNNEFTYSDRGAPLEGKAYTFRANPERVDILGQLGVDAVYLANNHVYDYGKEAMLDTFDTLDGAGIEFFGAGRNLEEACKPLYVEIEGKTIAFVAASRAEKFKMTPQATETEPGILRCYDTELFEQVIEEAAKNADYTIAVVHWGTEYSTELEAVQTETARTYIKAGADAIIGAHSHCLQGLEYVYGVPVVYSLGNYWFNEKTLDTMLARLHFYGDDSYSRVELELVPGVQEDWHTRVPVDEAEKRRIFDPLEDISINVKIDDDGHVHSSGPVPLIENLCEVRFEVDYPVGQITRDVTVSQDFISGTDSLVALDLLGATYKKDNTATIQVTLSVEEGEEFKDIAKWSLDSSVMEDNTVMEFVLADEVGNVPDGLDTDEKMVFYTEQLDSSLNHELAGRRCMITISSPDGEPDLSPTFWMTEDNNYPDGCLNIAGYDQYNDLWFQIYGVDK